MTPRKSRLMMFALMMVTAAPTGALAAALSEVIDPVFVVPPSSVGRSLCASDGWLFVSAQLDYVYATGDQYVGRVAVFREMDGGYEQVAVLQPPLNEKGLSGEAFDVFGHSIAVDGETAAIGAPSNPRLPPTGSAVRLGKLFVYRLVDDRWTRLQELIAPNAQYEDSFGFSVALLGRVLAVGAPTHTGNQSMGRVYLFEVIGEPGAAVLPLGAIDPPYPGAKWFGATVALDTSGEWLAVGAPGDIVENMHKGSVHLYHRGAMMGEWLLAQSIFGGPYLDPIPQGFGESLSFDQGTLVLGAPYETSWDQQGQGLRAAGSVYTYQFDGTSWQAAQRIPHPHPVSLSGFGEDVRLRGDTLIIGAPGRTFDSPFSQGLAYVYRFTGSQWDLADRVYPDVDQTSSYVFFGRAVALDASNFFVGDPGPDYYAWTERGTVFRATAPWPADANGDGDCDLDDFSAFADCFNGPETISDPEGPCATFDLDLDGDVDLSDMAVRQRAAKVAEE